MIIILLRIHKRRNAEIGFSGICILDRQTQRAKGGSCFGDPYRPNLTYGTFGKQLR